MATEDENRSRSKVRALEVMRHETLLLAAVPLLGYSVLFLFQYGYLSYYGLPSQLISLALSDVLAAALITFFVLGGAAVLFLLMSQWAVLMASTTNIPMRTLENIILFSMSVGLVGSILLTIYSVYGRIPALIAGGFVVTNLVPTTVILRRRSKHRAGGERVENWASRYIDFVWKHGRKWVLVSGLLYYAIAGTVTLGHAYASTETSYRVANTNPETVAIFYTADRVVLMSFDRNTKEIERGDFTVLPFDEAKGVFFRRENIGRLRVVD
jgi:hypothetical protein